MTLMSLIRCWGKEKCLEFITQENCLTLQEVVCTDFKGVIIMLTQPSSILLSSLRQKILHYKRSTTPKPPCFCSFQNKPLQKFL